MSAFQLIEQTNQWATRIVATDCRAISMLRTEKQPPYTHTPGQEQLDTRQEETM